MGINYGLNKDALHRPVPVNSRLRGHMHLLACEPIATPGLQMTWQVTVEREGADKPVCVAESLVRPLRLNLSPMRLAPGLIDRDGHRVGQVQAALTCQAWASAVLSVSRKAGPLQVQTTRFHAPNTSQSPD
jgi:hypothetical protein